MHMKSNGIFIVPAPGIGVDLIEKQTVGMKRTTKINKKMKILRELKGLDRSLPVNRRRAKSFYDFTLQTSSKENNTRELNRVISISCACSYSNKDNKF